jgi:hypothetical protein
MARVIPDRMCAQIDGDFVVFIIGMRVNKPWNIPARDRYETRAAA